MGTLSQTLILCVFSVLSATTSVSATTHIVGDDHGWTLGYNYQKWSMDHRFHVGDELVFKYNASHHSVVRVNETAFTNCIKEPNLGIERSGHDTISLEEEGQRWYICGEDIHCELGQKLQIKVLLASRRKL
ncbi:hypothetical protein AMTRI_Chr09g12960 [Amborella trichopoda]